MNKIKKILTSDFLWKPLNSTAYLFWVVLCVFSPDTTVWITMNIVTLLAVVYLENKLTFKKFIVLKLKPEDYGQGVFSKYYTYTLKTEEEN